MPNPPLLNPGNVSRDTFLESLGLIAGGAQVDSNKRFESLDWDSLINRHDKLSFNPLDSSKFSSDGEDPHFSSYSGSDVAIYLLFDDGDTRQGMRNFRPFREITTISVSSARSVHPVRRLGESHVTEYTRGARTIAGTIVCISADRDPILKIAASSVKEKFSDAPFFTDEVPSFSVLIIASDEHGNVSHAAISDLTITNFGQTFSVDDMYLENTYTYVARFYHPLLPDPSVLNKLRPTGSRNKLSLEFHNAWNQAQSPPNIKDFIAPKGPDNVNHNWSQWAQGLELLHTDDGADWAEYQDWIRKQAASQRSP